ncbi:MAG TPA: HD domain-containing protein [Blastocatellia bacterium]|nr:HD domain-containing protein [Blastocatellia bacterium]
MDYERTYEYLAGRLQPHLTEDELTEVRLAYEVAEAAHEGQMRDEGTPYILHPVRVAVSLVDELEIYSPRLVSSALLHDVIEDSPITRQQIAELFGEDVAEVVWLLTKFDDVSLPAYLSAIEAASDTGAAIVKLCDRLDNLRFLAHSPRAEKKRRYIHTTEAFYLPLARRTNKYLYDELSRWLEEARNHVKAGAGGRGSGIREK